MKFTDEERELVKRSYERYLKENELSKKDYPLNEETVRATIKAAHDKYSIIVDGRTHKLMREILRKAGEAVLEPEEVEKQREKERKIVEKEAKRRLKEKIEKEMREEAERRIKELGLIEEEPKEQKPPRKDVTKAEAFNNIVKALEEKANQSNEIEKALEEEMPDIDYNNFSNNTVVKLKELADFMKLEYDSTILKDDLINLIKTNI